MARRIIVHVGAPKTGTSAFQEWAVRNHGALLAAGFLYTAAGATPGGNHAALVSALGGAIEDEARTAHLVRLFEQDLAAHPTADIIISSELMTTLKFMPNMPRLRRALSRYGDEATVLLVVRDQIAWRNSCYAQTREMMARLPPFRNYVAIGKNGPRSGNWIFLEQKYRKAGFAFEALAFDRTVRDIGIVAAMTNLPSLRGLAGVAAEDRLEANPSVGDLALLVAEQVRATIAGPEGDLPPGLRPQLMPIVAAQTARLPRTSFNGFDPALADEIRSAYRDSNEEFAQRHFGAAWTDLFPPSLPSHVSCDTVSALPPRERRQVRNLAGQVLIEALERDLLTIAPR
jgi:hypothetical protein